MHAVTPAWPSGKLRKYKGTSIFNGDLASPRMPGWVSKTSSIAKDARSHSAASARLKGCRGTGGICFGETNALPGRSRGQQEIPHDLDLIVGHQRRRVADAVEFEQLRFGAAPGH